MCRISTISDDFITKGFHIHVNEVELVMRPDHREGIIFRKVFTGTSDRDAHPAIKIAMGLLQDQQWRDRFRDSLRKARSFVLNERGVLRDLANGRAREFNFLIVALDRMEKG